MTRALRVALFPAGVALGLYAEWAALRRGPLEEAASSSDMRLAAADFVVGVVLIGCGLIAWDHRPESWTGTLLTITGFTWFLGTFAASGWPGYAAFGTVFLTLHRGPLVHALLAYPSGRLQGRLERGAIATSYVLAAVAAAGETAGVTILLAGLVFAVALRRYLAASGPERRARMVAASAATAFSVVLLVSGLARLDAASAPFERGVLWAYDVVLIGISVALLLDLLLRRWTVATVTGLVVDLGELGETAPLRDRLAAALGDPSLIVGYRLAERDAYVDDRGRDLELPEAGSGRTITLVREGGEPVAALIRDGEVVLDPELVDSVAAAARIAVVNARLQAEIRSQLEEVEASRRRIVESADLQRRRVEGELREGAEKRLAEVDALLEEAARDAESDPRFAALLGETRIELEGAQAELREFARGIHPRLLTEGGLVPALTDLAARAPVPVGLSVTDGRLAAPLEAAAYFVCSEELANIGKYAEASRAAIAVEHHDGKLVVSVSDDGRGGVRMDAGSGLRGLADRVEALGGSLRIESPPGKGTLLLAELPLT